MPLVILPLVIAGFAILWLVLLPVSLIQRYRHGKKRRVVIGWMTRANAWLVLVSLLSFLIGAWMAQRWLDDALAAALIGLAAGFALGLASLWTSQFEWREKNLYVQPHAGISLCVTVLVAARIGVGFWQLGRHGLQPHPKVLDGPWLLRPDSLFAFGGLLLGHYFAWTWLLRGQLRRAPGP